MAFGSSVSNFLFGSSPTLQREPLRRPAQEQFQSQLLNSAQGLLGQVAQPTNIQPFLQQARERFSTQTIPSLAERFTSLGQGAQRSSAFQGALGNAAAGLESNLAGLQSQAALSDQQRLQSLLGGLIGPSLAEQDYLYQQPGSTGLFPAIGSGLGAGLGLFAPQLARSGLGSLGSLFGLGQQPENPYDNPKIQQLSGILRLLQSLKGGQL